MQFSQGSFNYRFIGVIKQCNGNFFRGFPSSNCVVWVCKKNDPPFQFLMLRCFFFFQTAAVLEETTRGTPSRRARGTPKGLGRTWALRTFAWSAPATQKPRPAATADQGKHGETRCERWGGLIRTIFRALRFVESQFFFEKNSKSFGRWEPNTQIDFDFSKRSVNACQSPCVKPWVWTKNRGRDRQMTSQCASPRARKKAPPPGQVRWRIWWNLDEDGGEKGWRKQMSESVIQQNSEVLFTAGDDPVLH